MPILNCNIIIEDSTCNLIYKLEQTTVGIEIFVRDNDDKSQWSEQTIWISKKEVPNFIKALSNLAGQW